MIIGVTGPELCESVIIQDSSRVSELLVYFWKYLDLERREWWDAAENCTVTSFLTYTLHHILLGWSNKGEWNGGSM